MQRAIPNPPKIFLVNWFRKGKDGKFLWPGFGENMRVLKWIVDRAHGRVGAPGDARRLGAEGRATSTSPASTSTPDAVDAATNIDLGEWKKELESQEEFFEKLGPTLPQPLELQREMLLERVPRRAEGQVAPERARRLAGPAALRSGPRPFSGA